MSDLWATQRARRRAGAEPLAVRMRPRSIEQVAGQRHILGEGKLLWRMLRADAITSLIFHGPPGTGKTTLAELIAAYTKRHFVSENAAGVGVKRVRQIADAAAHRLETSGQRTVLFLDEIHRFTRSQQDVLLEDVERGILTLIGATTQNPLFACNSALVSRSTLFRLEPLSIEDIIAVLRRAIGDAEHGCGALDLRVSDEALMVWAVKSDGDARRALTALEIAVLSSLDGTGVSSGTGVHLQWGGRPARQSGVSSGTGVPPASQTHPIVIDAEVARESIQQKAPVYDGAGDEHFDTISALIKSVRGSDPDAGVYWLARMLDAGEDPRYIARRMAILASEDIGNADPRSIVIAQSAWDLVDRIGMPEARITLSQLVIYLALAPKSNASYMAIESAMEDVREGRTLPVPIELRDPHAAPTGDGREPGKGYRYSHDAPGGVTNQDYLGVDRRYYEPTDRGAERVLGERLEAVRKIRRRRS